eukprot:1544431-Prymnesium_polylepis.3
MRPTAAPVKSTNTSATACANGITRAPAAAVRDASNASGAPRGASAVPAATPVTPPGQSSAQSSTVDASGSATKSIWDQPTPDSRSAAAPRRPARER